MTFNPITFMVFRFIAGLAGLSRSTAQLLRGLLLKVISRGQSPYSQSSRFFSIRELDN